MRRQNPPQSHMEKAAQIEGYVRKRVIGSIYIEFGVLFAAIMGGIFWTLIHESVLRPKPATITILSTLALVPLVAAVVAIFRIPQDPLSRSLMRSVQKWRRPFDVVSEMFTFDETMASGESVRIKLAFHYPVGSRTNEMKTRLYAYVHSTLANECATRQEPPDVLDVQRCIDASVENLALEYEIPVLYAEISELNVEQPVFGSPRVATANDKYWTGLGA